MVPHTEEEVCIDQGHGMSLGVLVAAACTIQKTWRFCAKKISRVYHVAPNKNIFALFWIDQRFAEILRYFLLRRPDEGDGFFLLQWSKKTVVPTIILLKTLKMLLLSLYKPGASETRGDTAALPVT